MAHVDSLTVGPVAGAPGAAIAGRGGWHGPRCNATASRAPAAPLPAAWARLRAAALGCFARRGRPAARLGLPAESYLRHAPGQDAGAPGDGRARGEREGGGDRVRLAAGSAGAGNGTGADDHVDYGARYRETGAGPALKLASTLRQPYAREKGGRAFAPNCGSAAGLTISWVLGPGAACGSAAASLPAPRPTLAEFAPTYRCSQGANAAPRRQAPNTSIPPPGSWAPLAGSLRCRASRRRRHQAAPCHILVAGRARLPLPAHSRLSPPATPQRPRTRCRPRSCPGRAPPSSRASR
jgi:hypothetical protein